MNSPKVFGLISKSPETFVFEKIEVPSIFIKALCKGVLVCLNRSCPYMFGVFCAIAQKHTPKKRMSKDKKRITWLVYASMLHKIE